MDVDKEISGKGDFDIVINKGSYGFKTVIDTFKDSKEIFIITYSIEENLLNKLYDLDGDQKIVIVTNIPGRFKNYKNDGARTNAKDKINHAEHILDSKKFKADTATYFNFNNHSKIILTDKLAYIGSQNYYGAYSFETGIIIKDKSCLKDIKNEIVDLIVDNSRPYSINKDFYCLFDIIELYKDIYRVLEDPLAEASLSYYECGVEQEYLYLSHKLVFKVYGVMLKIRDLIVFAKNSTYLKEVFISSLKKFNNCFLNDDIHKQLISITERKGITQKESINLMIACLNQYPQSSHILSVDELENYLEEISELSDQIEDFFYHFYNFFENKNNELIDNTCL